jgi:membrane protease YdiL (CAAX protease family)
MDISSLGFTKESLGISMEHSLAITLAGLAFLTGLGILTSSLSFVRINLAYETFYVLISVPLQELAFRGFLQARLERRYRPAASILLASSLFALIHLYNPFLVLLTFPAGLLWGYSFHRTGNLWGPISSHAVLGAYLSFLSISF